jgi:pilus assembly protein CpaB
MRGIGLILLTISILLGGIAVWGLRSLGRPAQAAPAPVSASTTVVVASRTLAFGEPLGPGALKSVTWPADAVPPGAFRSVGQVIAGPTRRALAPIAPDEPILASRISGPGGRATLANVIRPGMRAAALRIDDVAGVAGFVLPGDFVDVLATRNDGDATGAARTDVLVQGVRVLAVDQTAGGSKDDPVVAKAATVEVTPAQAQKIALAGHVGTLSLALRGVEDSLAPDALAAGGRTIRVSDLRLDGAAQAAAAPRHKRRATGGSGRSIQVYRAAEFTRVPVRAE